MANNNSGNKTGTKRKGSSKKKAAARKKRNRIILFIVELFVLVILGVVVFAVVKTTNEVEKINVEVDIAPEVQSYFDQINAASNPNGGESKGYMQVALFGVDSREGELSKNTRTDTIIIASVNLDTKEVKLCSVYRDTYLNLSNDSYNKANSAYARGGPEQAIQMLNMNLDLNIENYLTVGFKGVVETVDALGGVQIDVDGSEIGYMNDYQYCIAEDLNRMNDYIKVTNSGLQTLNGLQACGYCRIRYTQGDDFRRTERQRTVLTEMVNEAKQTDPATLANIATSAFSNVSTSFDLNTILEYAGDVVNYNIVGSEGFPFADYRAVGTIGSKGSCVVPTDLTTNVSLLHNYLFGIENYDPTDTVKTCSQQITADTSGYL